MHGQKNIKLCKIPVVFFDLKFYRAAERRNVRYPFCLILQDFQGVLSNKNNQKDHTILYVSRRQRIPS